MFTNRKQTNSEIDTALVSAYTALHNAEETSREYAHILDQIVKLERLKDESSSRVTADTLALIGANLAGIILIISHEHAHVIATKAMSMVPRLK